MQKNIKLITKLYQNNNEYLVMKRIFVGVLLLISIAILQNCNMAKQSFRSKPINISNKKYKTIQSRSKVYTRERSHFHKSSVNWAQIRKNQTRHKVPVNRNYYNISAKNRNLNRNIVTRRNKRNTNYQFYKDSMEATQAAEKSNFSIYDR